MTLRDDTPVIDREHPWPWLDAFPESARDFFNGRDEAAQQLLRCVLAAPATVLFGKSGLGKTSLLQAGLSPLLREEQLLPVLVRLTHDSSYQPGRLSARLLARLDEEAAAHGLRCERPPLPEGIAATEPTDAAEAAAPPEASAASRLWEQLHDSEAQWLDAQGEEWTPVFILDQFEEAFTLLHDAEAQQRLFSELGNLIQNRTPAEVAERRKAHEPLRRRLDPERLAARFVLSLREDYLPDLEIHADRIPRLGPNRYRLLPMSQADALQAIETTGGALVDTADAERIVQFLDQQNQQSTDAGRPRAQRRERIEPALLSLVCAGLNQHRLDQRAEKLDTRSIDLLGRQLLEQFYDQSFIALPQERREDAAYFVETELITPDGTRRQFPEISISESNLTSGDIYTLRNKRLLRTENTENGPQIELVHDRLAEVAAQRAKLRRERLKQAEIRAAADAEERRRKLRRSTLIGFFISLVAALSLGLIGMWHQSKKTDAERQKTEKINNELASTNKRLDENLDALRHAIFETARARETTNYMARLADVRASEAERQTELANIQRLHAIAAERSASDIANEKTQQFNLLKKAKGVTHINEILSRAMEISNDQRPGNIFQAVLQTLAAHRIAQQNYPEALSSTYSALQRLAAKLQQVSWLSQTGRNFALAINKDETVVVTSPDTEEDLGRLQVWDTKNGHLIGLSGDRYSTAFKSIVYSPNGDRIYGVGFDGSIVIWSSSSLKIISKQTFEDQELGKISSLSVSASTGHIAVGTNSGFLIILNSQSLQPIAKRKIHGDTIFDLNFSRDGNTIATASHDGSAAIVEAKDLGSEKKFLIKGIKANCAQLDTRGNRFFVGGSDGRIKVWDLSTGAQIDSQISHANGVFSIKLSDDGKWMISSSADGSINVWDITKKSPSRYLSLQGHNHISSSIAVTRDAKRIFSTGFDGTLIGHIGPEANNQTVSSSDSSKIIFGLSVVPGSNNAYVYAYGTKADSDGEITRRRLGENITEFAIGENREGYGSSLAVSPDGKYIATGGSDREIRVHEYKSDKKIATLRGHAGTVRTLSFSPDGKLLASGGLDGSILIWDTSNWSIIHEKVSAHKAGAIEVSYNPDGTRLASVGSDGKLKYWDATSHGLIISIDSDEVLGLTSVAFNPSGSERFLVVSCGLQHSKSELEWSPMGVWAAGLPSCRHVQRAGVEAECVT